MVLCIALLCAAVVARAVGASGSRGPVASSRQAAHDCDEAARADVAEAERLRAQQGREPLLRAAEKLEAARRCWRRARDAAAEADALIRLGEVAAALGERERARASYAAAVKLKQQSNDPRGAAEAACGLSRALSNLFRADEALAPAQSALDAARALSDARLAARAHLALGHAHYFRGDPHESRRQLEEAVRLVPADDPRTRAESLFELGHVYYDAGEFERGFQLFEESLRAWEALGDAAGQAGALTAIGRALTFRGERQSALEQQRRALRLAESAGDRAALAVAQNNLGLVYETLGQHEQALEAFERALQNFTDARHAAGRANTLQYVGNAHDALGRGRLAREFYARGLAESRALKDTILEAYALNNLGVLEQREGRASAALENFRHALAIYEQAGNRRWQAYALANAGFAEESLGRRAEAFAAYERALALIESAGDREGELFARHNLARLLREAGRLDEARAHCEKSLELIERLRAKVSSPEHRTSYFASVHRHYELYVDVLMALAGARPAEARELAASALRASERARARTLLETLAEVRAGIRHGVEPALAERLRALQLKIDQSAYRQTQLLSGPHAPQQAEDAARELRALLAEQDELRGEIRARSPRYASLVEPQPVGPAEIGSLLDADAVLVEFALGERRSFVWAVGREGFVSRELPPRAEIERAARGVFELLTARQSLDAADFAGRERRAAELDARYWREAAALSRMILAPVAAEIGRARRILFVADGALHLVPFDALPKPQSEVPLLLEHEIVNLPSASALAALRQEGAARGRATGAVAVLADPVYETDDPRVASTAAGVAQSGEGRRDQSQSGGRAWPRLPASREEAEAIMSVVPEGAGRKIVGFEATRAAAANPELARYRVVHFATHGLFDERRPELSGVVLSLVDEHGARQDGYLRLHDIYNLSLPVELVVLSACETARGREVRGEGLVGLTRGFMYAGAGGVVASLWKVDDDATAALMRHFYRGLLAENLEPAAALRAARLAVRADERWRAPYYWAAFVLQGEPGAASRRPEAAASRGAASPAKIAAGVGLTLALSAGAVYALRRRRRSLAAPSH